MRKIVIKFLASLLIFVIAVLLLVTLYNKEERYNIEEITPKVTDISVKNGSIKITWEHIVSTNITSYRVYRSSNIDTNWKLIKPVSNRANTFTDTVKIADDVIYRYAIRGCDTSSGSTKLSQLSNIVYSKGITPIEDIVPLIVDAHTDESGSVRITWDKIKYPFVTSYRIYKRTSDNKWELVSSVGSSETSYTDTLTEEGLYQYAVRACDSSNGEYKLSKYSEPTKKINIIK